MNGNFEHPEQSLPVAKLLEIDKICRQFEAAWKAGSQPKIEAFLAGAEPADHRSLLRELLLLDIEYRQQAGETPTVDDYLRQFPDAAALLETVFSAKSVQTGIEPIPHAAKPQGESSGGQKSLPRKQSLPSLNQFLDSLTGCGLMNRPEVEAFLNTFPPETRPQDSKHLAEELFRQKKLTKFQVQAIYQGKTRGLVVGNYVVLDWLGQGGMGQVYKAKHQRMDRVVALKVLPSTATKSPESVQRFQREAKAAARLSHPNIVTAHDADESEGIYFLVMEYVDGHDLASLVNERGPLAVAEAVDYIVQAARGLEYAHSKGVIHRDIKPHNLLLDKQKTVKVLDMGLARIVETVGALDSITDEAARRVQPGRRTHETVGILASTTDEGLTQQGQVMGTLAYMSPEQSLDACQADVRADIYSLGCTMHYLLVGRSPYSGDTVKTKILAHREQPIPSLRAVREDVPESLDVIFQKMVAKRPEDRQQTMGEVIVQLQACAVEQTAGVGNSVVSPSPVAETVTSSRHDVETFSQHPEATPFDEEYFFQQPVAITARLLTPPHPKLAKRPSKPQKIAIGAAVALAFLAVFLTVILRVQTKEGTLVVELNDSDVTVQILSDEGKLQIERAGQQGSLEIAVDLGKHRLKVVKGNETLYTQDFTIATGGRETIRAKLEPAVVKAADRKQQAPPPPPGEGTDKSPLPPRQSQGTLPTRASEGTADQALMAGLAGYWPFEGDGKDLSACSRDLTMQGGVGFASGLFGQAVNLPGDGMKFAKRPVDDNVFNFGAADFTIQVWLNYNNTEGEQVLIEKWSESPRAGWTLTKLSENVFLFATGGMGNFHSSRQTITKGVWHHVVARRTASTFEILFDNSRIASASVGAAGITSVSAPLLIGRRYDSRVFATNGLLDETAIWPRSLRDAEIGTLYNNGAGYRVVGEGGDANRY